MAIRIGITGGIATGKSTISNLLMNLGYQVIDSDLLAKDILKNNEEVIRSIMDNFPEAVEPKSKTINRSILAEVIFNDSSKRQVLNNIVHPRVKEIIVHTLLNTSEEIIFVDVPLLYEARFEDLFDYIIVVYTDYDSQIKRLVERDNISIEYANAKILAQMSIEDKKEKADFVIDNSLDLIESKKQLLEIIGIISRKG